MTDALPESIGKYRIIAELGRGGFASVYRAYDPDLARQVAVKHPHPEYIIQPSFVQKFRKEAEIAAKLAHPNIVTVLEVIKEGDLAIAMLLAEGPSLDTIIHQRGPFAWHAFLPFFEQICQALDYAHRNGVLHCDLKPGNVLTDGHNRPLLSDFGLSRMTDTKDTEKTSSVGTIGYTAPEVLNRKPITRASDIYSLGCIAGEMLSGQRLFRELGDQFKSTPFYTLPEFAGWPSSVPPGIEPVLDRAIHPTPDERYPSAMAFYEALAALTPQKVTAPIGIPTQPIPLTEPIAQPAPEASPAPQQRRRTWLLPAMIGGILVAFGGFGSFLAFGGGLIAPAANLTPPAQSAASTDQTAPVADRPATAPAAEATPDMVATLVAATNQARAQSSTIEAAVNATGAAIQATSLADRTAGAEAQATAGADQTATALVGERTAEAEQAALQSAEANATSELATASANALPTATSRPAASPTPRPAASPTVRPTAGSTNTPRPTVTPVPASPTTASSGVVDPGGSGSLFRGTINEGSNGDGPATCVQGSVKRADGGNYGKFYVQVDLGGTTTPTKHDYASGTFALCGLGAGTWGVAVYTVEDVPTSDSERIAHQVRFRASGTAGEIFFVNFRALKDPPTPTPVPIPPTATPIPPGPYDGFWEGTLRGTTTTGEITAGRFAFEIRNNVVFYTASSGASCIWEDRNIAATVAGNGFRHGGRASLDSSVYYEVSATFASTTSASGGLYADQGGVCITDASWSATRIR
jgi:eukaryotic-like serine/threonine-protein kinase